MIKKTNLPTIKYKLTPKAKEIYKQFEKATAFEIINKNKEMIISDQEQLEQIDLT